MENSPDTTTVVLLIVVTVLALFLSFRKRFKDHDYYEQYNQIGFVFSAIVVLALCGYFLFERLNHAK